MNKEVIIIPTAEKALLSIKKFILDNHTQREFDKLKHEIEKILKQLEKGNVDYKYSKSTNTYKVVVSKRCSLYYKKINDKRTDVVYFIDNKMMRGKSKYE